MAASKKPAAPKPAATTTPVKPKPRKLSTAQLQARIGRDSAELARRAGVVKKPASKSAGKK